MLQLIMRVLRALGLVAQSSPQPTVAPVLSASTEATRAMAQQRASVLYSKRSSPESRNGSLALNRVDGAVLAHARVFLSEEGLERLSQLSANEYWFMKLLSMTLYMAEQTGERVANLGTAQVRAAAAEIFALCASSQCVGNLISLMRSGRLYGAELDRARQYGLVLTFGSLRQNNPIFVGR